MEAISGFYYQFATYAPVLLGIWASYFFVTKRSETNNRAIQTAAIDAGLGEPASLHPVIDPVKCLGCGACTRVCPEGDVLGLINNKAVLIEPSECIGHGACKTACPRQAISLVFGTATRGVDIPLVGPDFQTNVPGIYIAGELGGMGLIRNAIEQGRQAIEQIGRRPGIGTGSILDVMIVGGGPAGFAASLGALERKLRFVTVEQESLGGTVAHFPRGKLVMTAPAVLPLIGTMPFREVSKEKLLTFWQDAAAKTGLKINYDERVVSVTPRGNAFEVVTTKQVYQTRAVLLAIGRRGTPRRLNVAGEDLAKVVYRVVDPEQYRGQHVLVVGGGDSALEAAASIAEQPATKVTLSYRGSAFARAKPKNRARFDRAVASGRAVALLGSNVMAITERHVELERAGQRIHLPNTTVVVCAGGILPTAFLEETGIGIERKYGTH